MNAVIEWTLRKLQDYRVAILTGGTKGGVPEDALKIAKKYGLNTIWVYPARGAKNATRRRIYRLCYRGKI